jgi:hypothetical protein
MHQTAIIPNHDIAGLPFVAVLEFLLSRMFEEFVEQRQGFVFRHADNLFNADRVDVDRLAACFRMRSDDRMNGRLGLIPSSRLREARQLSLAVFALIACRACKPSMRFFISSGSAS